MTDLTSIFQLGPSFLGELKLWLEHNPPTIPAAAVQGLPVVVTGLVNGNATIADGNGFTAHHTSTGVYAIAFNVDYATAPTLQVTLTEDLAMLAPVVVAGWDGTGFTVKTSDSTGTPADCAFSFTARPTF